MDLETRKMLQMKIFIVQNETQIFNVQYRKTIPDNSF